MNYKITIFLYKNQDFSCLQDKAYVETDRHSFISFKTLEDAEQFFKSACYGENDLIENLDGKHCKSIKIAITDRGDKIVKVLAKANF